MGLRSAEQVSRPAKSARVMLQSPRPGRRPQREPSVSAKGFSEDPEAFNPVIPLLTAALDRSAEDGITDPHQLQQVVRRTVGRWVNDAYRRRPMIVPTVVEV